MGSRQPMHESATGSRRARLPLVGVRAAILAALLGAGLLAAVALAASHPAGAQPHGSTITSATRAITPTGSSSVPKGVWLTFEANPVSFVLGPLRKFAACVRRHGITRLRDPKVVDGKVVLMLPRGLTPKSPRLKKAQRACQKLLPQGANTQPGTGDRPDHDATRVGLTARRSVARRRR
jgi:hypothetical protein